MLPRFESAASSARAAAAPRLQSAANSARAAASSARAAVTPLPPARVQSTGLYGRRAPPPQNNWRGKLDRAQSQVKASKQYMWIDRTFGIGWVGVAIVLAMCIWVGSYNLKLLLYIGIGVFVSAAFMKQGDKFEPCEQREIHTFTQTFVLRRDLGLATSAQDLAKEHFSYSKVFFVMMLILRVALNTQQLTANVSRLLALKQIPQSGEYAANVIEAIFTVRYISTCCVQSLRFILGHPVALSELKDCITSLAGFSSMKLVSWVNPTRLIQAQKRSADSSNVGLVIRVMMTPVLGFAGLSVFIAKIHRLQGLGMNWGKKGAEADVYSLLREFIGHLSKGTWQGVRDAGNSELMLLIGFVNQVLSTKQEREIEIDRLFLFVFGRHSAKYTLEERQLKERYWYSICRKFRQVGNEIGYFKAFVLWLGFNSDDLQKLCIFDTVKGMRERKEQEGAAEALELVNVM